MLYSWDCLSFDSMTPSFDPMFILFFKGILIWSFFWLNIVVFHQGELTETFLEMLFLCVKVKSERTSSVYRNNHVTLVSFVIIIFQYQKRLISVKHMTIISRNMWNILWNMGNLFPENKWLRIMCCALVL